ncbi:MAG TPA: cupredoxin domain-containing protein [Gammaproteobacteria bacterium]|nr:cupredoxin domain-containing protein [Gammaproteobacteria bacterium]
MSTAADKALRRAMLALLAAAVPMTVAAAELPTFHVEAKAGRFHPERVVVPAGVRFKIVVTNRGPGPEEFESIELKKETVLAPGVSRSVVFAPLKPGVYRFFGEFHPDTARGEIVVVDERTQSGN